MGDGPPPPDLTTRFIEGATVLIPFVALVALVLIIFAGHDQAEVVSAVPQPVAAAAPTAAPTAVASFTDIGVATSAPAASGSKAPAQTTSESEGTPVPSGSPVVQVRPGEKVQILDAPGGDRVATVGDVTEFGSPSVFGVFRHTDSWVGVATPLLPNGELGWIKADPRKLFGGYVNFTILVDLSTRTARLFHGGTLMRSWSVTVGAPGSDTPIGRFAVTDTFRGDLNPVYGCCAVALTATQPNIASDWLGGNRIAFHGTDGPLGVAKSHGCIRSADGDVSALVGTVPLGTPVEIRP